MNEKSQRPIRIKPRESVILMTNQWNYTKLWKIWAMKIFWNVWKNTMNITILYNGLERMLEVGILKDNNWDNTLRIFIKLIYNIYFRFEFS